MKGLYRGIFIGKLKAINIQKNSILYLYFYFYTPNHILFFFILYHCIFLNIFLL